MALKIFKKIFADKKLPEPDPQRPGRYRYPPRSGVDDLTAIPAAYAAIGLLSSTLAQLPRTVVHLEDPLDDYWTPQGDHPVTELLRRPSRLVDPWLFWEWMFRGLFAAGNSYAWIRRSDAGRPLELVPATCTAAQWRGNPPLEHARVHYELKLWGPATAAGLSPHIRVEASEVVALHGPGFDGLASPSPVQYAASSTLEVMHRAQDQQKSMLQSSSGMGAAIATDASLADRTEEQKKQHREALAEGYTRARERGEIPVLPPGYSLATTGAMSAVDIQLIELLKWSVEDIARVWNVPVRLLHHYHAGFRTSSFEQQAVDYERWTVSGHVQRIQEQLGGKLLSPQEAADNLAIRLPTDRIRAGSWSERVNSVDQAVAKAGVMWINEGRRLLRLPALPDGNRLLQPKGAPAQDASSADDGEREDDAA